MKTVAVEQSFAMEAPPDRVWPFVADTDRMNRRVGLGGVAYEPLDAGARTGARLRAHTRLGGFATTYEEQPWEWTWSRRLQVHRDFQGSPIAWLEAGWSLEPRGEGTTLRCRLEALPRLAVLRPLVWANLLQNARAFGAVAVEIDAHLRSGEPSPFLQPVTPADPEALARAARALGQREVPSPLVERLLALVRDAPDADCVRLRPFELAQAWDLDRRAVLRGFLHGVQAGLFEMRWFLLCPSCRTSAAEVPTLDQVTPEGHCNQCDLGFEAELDLSVEAAFRPAPAVRAVPPLLFCAAGPARTPHVLVQANLAPGQQRTLLAPPQPGTYGVFARGGGRAGLVVDEAAGATAMLELLPDGVSPREVRVRPWGELVVKNSTLEHRHVKVERREYASLAVTAHELSTVPEFRAFFSRDLLKAGTALKVSRVSLLFTDLTGSTALYAALGDAAAFRFVDDHFDLLRQAVAAAGGTVVKTMGDAVMAAFTDDAAAVRGALGCLRAFDAWRLRTPHGDATGLKVGVHAGPCYAVTANGVLDYFGQTVNVAARLQGLAASSELVLCADALPGLPEDVRAALDAGQSFPTQVKGVPEALRVVRARAKP